MAIRQMLEDAERRVTALEQAVRQPVRRPVALVSVRTVVERYLRNLRTTLQTNVDEARRMLSVALDRIVLKQDGPHRLGAGLALRRSLATTNGLESIFALVEQHTGKVDRWQNSDQKQRWLAAALLDIEARLRRLRGYHSLPQLRRLLRKRAVE